MDLVTGKKDVHLWGDAFSKVVRNVFWGNFYGSWRKHKHIFEMSLIDFR